MKERCIIAAVDENNAIGYKGDQLHYISRDLKHFKELTTGNIVIMGRRTYEAIGKPLPNRTNIVVTSKGIDFPPEGTTVFQVKTLEAAYELAEKLDGKKVYVIGGGQLYEAAMPYTQTIELTEILTESENVDTYFPSSPELWNDFVLSKATLHYQDYPGGLYRFATYKRIISTD
jgi:dihydrofolate reductase